MRTTYYQLAATLILLLGVGYYVWDQRIVMHDAHGTDFVIKRVAHAGGGLDGRHTYTNSYQALAQNIRQGFDYFELDFVFTSDSQLVCLHDWQGNFQRTFGFDTNKRLTLAEFKLLSAENTRWTNCTLDGLQEWMSQNLSAYIVTDVKEDNLIALRMMLEVLPDAKRRVIPQIYRPRNYQTVKDLGFEQIIWTLYLYTRSTDKVLRQLREFKGAVAVTMPISRTSSQLPQALSTRGIPTYVHTINDPKEASRYLSRLGITEIYTDFLSPNQIAP